MDTTSQLVLMLSSDYAEVSPAKRFGEMGMDSLDYLEMLIHCEQVFDVSLPKGLLVETPQELAFAINAHKRPYELPF